jgi:hypothetical protein
MTTVDRNTRSPSIIDGYPSLSDEAVGNLRFSWRRALEDDDWSKEGEMSLAWDRWTCWPYIAKTTYHLTWYLMLVAKMANETPAWREVHLEIAKRTVNRSRQYGGWYDWVDQKGLDPNRASYPYFFYKHFIPKGMAGAYNSPGYAGNGLSTAMDGLMQSIVMAPVEHPKTKPPYFHQHSPGVGRSYDPDPIYGNGSSNIMFRGYFLLQLMLGKMISDDPSFDEPVDIVYDDDIRFRYSAGEIAAGLDEQLRTPTDPQGSPLVFGLDCEVSKVFPYCMTIAGMGMQLHDRLHGTEYGKSFDAWLQVAKDFDLMAGGGEPGGLFEWISPYFDRDLMYTMKEPEQGMPLFGAILALNLLMQDEREYADRLYESVIKLYSRVEDDGARRLVLTPHMVGPMVVDDIWGTVTLMHYAYETGDAARYAEFKKWVDRTYEPTFADGEFYYRFGIREAFPRGIPNEFVMQAHVGGPGSFARLIEPDPLRFTEPTVVGIDFPTVNVRQAFYDRESRVLAVAITAGPRVEASNDRTSFRVTNLAGPACLVSTDGAPAEQVAVAADGAIVLHTTVADHTFRIEC